MKMVGELPLHSDSSPSSRTMDRSSSNAVLEFEIDEGWGAAEAEEESGKVIEPRSCRRSLILSIGATAVRAMAPARAPAKASVAARLEALCVELEGCLIPSN